MGTKIIQIMPAPEGLMGVAWDDDGNRKEVPVLAIGLTDCGTIEFLYVRNGYEIGYAKEVVYHA